MADDPSGFSSPSKFPSRLMSAGVPFGVKMGASIANGSRGTGSVGPSGIPWGGSNGGGVMWGSSSSSPANDGS
ncbi:hypothetical protein RF20_26495 [Salmonella enterica]|nr:hypothetical protein [Salmonella enterica]